MAKHRDCPWLILDLVAVLQNSQTLVSCRVENPENGSLEITLDGPHGDEVITGELLPNCPNPYFVQFGAAPFPPGTPVYAQLFDSSGNLKYQTQTYVAPSLVKLKTEAPKPAKTKGK
jgi:hypothetical protein